MQLTARRKSGTRGLLNEFAPGNEVCRLNDRAAQGALNPRPATEGAAASVPLEGLADQRVARQVLARCPSPS